MDLVLDRRQVVRQRVLVPSFAGSNPAGPAIFVAKKAQAVYNIRYMAGGLYKKSVDDSIDPHLPGKKSREEDKARAAEEARARLRGGEDAAADGSGASGEDNAQDLENGGGGLYVSGGGAAAISTRNLFRRGMGFGKGKKGKGGKKSGFRRYGPMVALFGMIFGAGGIIGAVQGLMPFHVVEQVTEMFDGSFTSRANRLPKMMKNIADMDGETGKLKQKFLTKNYSKYRRGLKKYKKKLATQGIDMVKEDGKTVLKWKNHLGEDVTIKAENFADFYKANTDFRNDFSRGTRGFMGRIAAWIDLSAARFFSSHALTKNLWKDWQQETFRKEGRETKFKDIIRGRKPDVDVDVGTSKVEEQEKWQKVVIDGEEKWRISEVAHMDPDYKGPEESYVAKTSVETKSAKTKADFVDSLTSIAGSISSVNCAAAAIMTTAVGIGYAMLQENSQNTWQGVAEGVDKTKAGDGANAPIYDIGNYLSNKMTASAMISIMSGGKIAPAQDSSLSKLNLSTIYGKVELGAGVAVTCAIAKAAIATVSIIVTLATGGVSKAISAISKTIVGVAIQGAAATALGLLVDDYLESFTTDLCLDTREGRKDDTPTEENDDAGNCLAIGGLNALQTNFKGGGGTPGSVDKVSDFYDAYQLALQQEAEYDRATKSPFDATNGNTFLGSLVNSLVLPVAQLSTSPAGFISSIGGLLQSSVSSLLPSASAISKTEYLANQIGSCPLAESVGAVGNSIDCSPVIISDMGTMDEDPDDVVNIVASYGNGGIDGKNGNGVSESKGHKVNGVEEAFNEQNFEMDGGKIALDENGIEKIKKGSHLDKYIRYCSYRESPLGIVDQNIISAETTASANTGNGTVDSFIDGALGSVPVIGDVVDIWNAHDEMTALQWATGANCVARSEDDKTVFASSQQTDDVKMLGMERTGEREDKCYEWDDEEGGGSSNGKAGESTSCKKYPKDDVNKDICKMKNRKLYAPDDEYDEEVKRMKESCYGHQVGVRDVEYDTLSWKEVKWYQRYVEDDRLVEMVDGEHSAVQNLLASYEEENPVDNSTAGVIARKTGMLKEDVEVALNEMAYWEYLADYEPSDLYPTPVKHVDEAAALEQIKDNTKTELPDAPEGLVSARVWYAPLRDRYSATA